MSNNQSNVRPPRVLFFGMPGVFSATVLQALLQGEVEIAAVVLAGMPVPGQKRGPAIRSRLPDRRTRKGLPLLNRSGPNSLANLISEYSLTTWEVLRFSDPETLETLASYRADLICVACFSVRIPAAILALPRLGGVNVHPSLLPHNRGPVPLFWTFRDGETRTGVTIHRLEEKLDSGAMLAQEAFDLPDGISYAELEERCAVLGGRLLTRVTWEMQRGRFKAVPQDESKSSYRPFPDDPDFALPLAEVDARHAYNFVAGIGRWDQPPGLQLQSGSRIVRSQQAISYSHKKPEQMPEGVDEWREGGNTLWLRCRAGWVAVVEV